MKTNNNRIKIIKMGMGAFCLFLALMTSYCIMSYADSETCSISQDTLNYYRGDVTDRYVGFQPDPLDYGWFVSDEDEAVLFISDGEKECENVTWYSDNTAVARVDENGRVIPVGFGTAVISGDYNNKKYYCKVFVREIRFYFWQEYTGKPDISRWAWDNACCPAVGQTIPYKLIEITYDKDQKEIERKDVTLKYPLSADNDEYIKLEPGTITAIKGNSDQLNLTSGVYHVFENTGVPYAQMIRFHVFTSSWDKFNEYVKISDDCDEKNAFVLEADAEALGYGGSITYDDEFLYSPDWAFYRYTTEELTWKSSDPKVLTIDKVTGSEPSHLYSTAYYTLHGEGKVKVSAYLNGNEVASYIKEVNCAHLETVIRDYSKATCSTEGFSGDVYCKKCGALIKTGTITKELGHRWRTKRTTDKKATYAAKGIKSIHCSVCDEIDPDSVVFIPKLTVKATKITEVVAAKKGFTVKWKKVSGITGCEVQYALNKKFTKGKKSFRIKKAYTTSKKIKKLKAKKKYYVRIRAYKIYKGKKYYSKWSITKTVKTKK